MSESVVIAIIRGEIELKVCISNTTGWAMQQGLVFNVGVTFH